MQRGFLIAYDNQGKAYIIEGEANGDILPHEMPKGDLKVIEIPYGSLEGVLKFKINVETQEIEVLERLETSPTYEELRSQNDALKIQLLTESGVL